MSTWTVRKKVVDARTSASSGTAVVTTITELLGHDLDEFSELLIYLDVNTALVGSTPKMDIYLQRALVEDPDPTDDTHWTDLFAFSQVAASTVERLAHLPVDSISTQLQSGSRDIARTHAALSAGQAVAGHWGDRIRIVEKMTNTITTKAVYDITFTGLLRVVN